ncbi:hypothetical protein GGS20DRAFT_414121 [Poronia punctata]|nr:hypothetical protein GGS20DRAFT_414121 [Poronia punctata]
MADETTTTTTTPPQQTPVPVPTYGQPQPQPQPQSQSQATDAPNQPEQESAPITETAKQQDIVMTDTPSSDQTQLPAAAAAAATAPPPRTGTPLRNMTQENSSSRAASQHPDQAFTMPDSAPPHGAPVRQYLNSKVTPHLLDGMKLLAKERPKDPLRALGEFLLERSKEFDNV